MPTYKSNKSGNVTMGNTFHDVPKGQMIALRFSRGVEVEFKAPEHLRKRIKAGTDYRIIERTKELFLQFRTDAEALDALETMSFVVNEALRQVKMRLGEQTKDLNEWTKAVKERDQQCVRCGAKKPLNACYIESPKIYPELQYYVGNGITLCDDCKKDWYKGDEGARKGYLHWWLSQTTPEHRLEELDDWMKKSGIF